MSETWVKNCSVFNRIRYDLDKFLGSLRENGIEYIDDMLTERMKILGEFIKGEREKSGLINRLTSQPHEILQKIILQTLQKSKKDKRCRYLRIVDTRMLEAYDTFAPQECKIVVYKKKNPLELPFGWLYSIKDIVPSSKIIKSVYRLEWTDKGYYDVHYLFADLNYMSSLTTLKLRAIKIDYEKVKTLALVLQTTSTLTTLNLTGNLLSFAGIRDFTIALRTNSTLTSLTIKHNSLVPTDARDLADALLNNSTLVSLNLRNNDIGSGGAQELAKALRSNSTLKNLNLSHNEIGQEGIRALSQMLTTNSTLTSLNLGINSIANVHDLAQALRINSGLTTLDLEGTGLSTNEVNTLAQALEINSTLTTLNLKHNMYYAHGSLPKFHPRVKVYG